MFTSTPLASLFAGRSRDQALEAWRDAADVVGARWQTFLEADVDGRPWAFARYVAAVDAEETAAAELAALTLTDVAA
jgi:hypothetical protein